MKALVTGASGFIGSGLISELGRLGFEVFALMRSSSSAANLEGLAFKRVEGSLGDSESLHRAVRGMDYVFHLAGVTAAPNREGYFEPNAHGTARLAEAVAVECPNLQRFVYVSSQAAAGPSQSLEPRVESQKPEPVSAYGESKLAGERAVLRYKDRFPVSIVRPPMVYGPKDKGMFVMIQTVSRNLMPLIRGSGESGEKYYSAIHVDDLIQGIVQAGVAKKDKVPSGEVFYVSGDGIFTYREILGTIAECLNLEPLRINVPPWAVKVAARGAAVAGRLVGKTFPLNQDKVNEILPDYWICSNAKAKERLGFRPEYDLKSGMAHAIEWYRRNKWI